MPTRYLFIARSTLTIALAACVIVSINQRSGAFPSVCLSVCLSSLFSDVINQQCRDASNVHFVPSVRGSTCAYDVRGWWERSLNICVGWLLCLETLNGSWLPAAQLTRIHATYRCTRWFYVSDYFAPCGLYAVSFENRPTAYKKDVENTTAVVVPCMWKEYLNSKHSFYLNIKTLRTVRKTLQATISSVNRDKKFNVSLVRVTLCYTVLIKELPLLHLANGSDFAN